MSIAAPKAVAVIGAGFSGLICAIHLLLKSSRGGPRIYLIERREAFGVGAAYSTDNPGHLLNTRANMSVFADRPDHFLSWLQDRGKRFDGNGSSFVSRRIYREYLPHAPAATDAIEAALGDGDWMVREIAADTLAARPSDEAIANTLIAALDDEFWQVRLKAVRAVSPIAASLRHAQANLRKEAAAALGEIGDALSRPDLGAAQDDPDPDVRKTVRWALKQLAG